MLQPAATLHNASISAALMQDPSRIDPGSRLCAARAMGEGRGASVVSLLETPYRLGSHPATLGSRRGPGRTICHRPSVSILTARTSWVELWSRGRPVWPLGGDIIINPSKMNVFVPPRRLKTSHPRSTASRIRMRCFRHGFRSLTSAHRAKCARTLTAARGG